MVKFVVDFAKTGTRPRPTGGWTRRHSAAITRRSGRRLPSFWTHRRRRPRDRQRHRTARCHLCTAHAATGLVAERYFSIPSGQHRRVARRTKASPICARRSASISPILPGRWRAGESSGQLLAAILCINVLHISPWRVSQNLFAGAGTVLACRRPFVRVWPVHARRRTHGAEQRSLRCHLAG